jgi:hypothetical protein
MITVNQPVGSPPVIVMNGGSISANGEADGGKSGDPVEVRAFIYTPNNPAPNPLPTSPPMNATAAKTIQGIGWTFDAIPGVQSSNPAVTNHLVIWARYTIGSFEKVDRPFNARTPS